MGERSHQENLYALMRNAQKRKFLGQGDSAQRSAEGAMVVNSGSLLVKRCQQAKEMHGITAAATSNHSKEGIRTEDATAVRDGLSGRPGSCGMGPTNDGNKVRTGRAAQILPESNGYCKG